MDSADCHTHNTNRHTHNTTMASLSRQNSVMPTAGGPAAPDDSASPTAKAPLVILVCDKHEADDQAAAAVAAEATERGDFSGMVVVHSACSNPPHEEQRAYWDDKFAAHPLVNVFAASELPPMPGTPLRPVIWMLLSPMRIERPDEFCAETGLLPSEHVALLVQGDESAYNQRESSPEWQEWMKTASGDPFCVVMSSASTCHRPCPLLHQKMIAKYPWAVSDHLTFTIVSAMSSPSPAQAPHHWFRLPLRGGQDGPNLVGAKGLRSLLGVEPGRHTADQQQLARDIAEKYVDSSAGDASVEDCEDKDPLVAKMAELIMVRWDLVAATGVSLEGEQHLLMVDAHIGGPPSEAWRAAVGLLAQSLGERAAAIDPEEPLAAYSPLYDAATAVAAVDLARARAPWAEAAAAVRRDADDGAYLQPAKMLAMF